MFIKRVLFISLIFVNVSQLVAQQAQCTQLLNQFSEDSLMKFVYELVGRKTVAINGQNNIIASRQYLHPGNRLAEDYLKETFERFNFTVWMDTFSMMGVNVLAYKQGTEFPDKAILLCAHFDNVGNATSPFEGADDNASGTATLLETARLMQFTTTPYSIVLAAWDEEERGLLGSKAWAPSGSGTVEPVAVINMDMIAYDNNNDSLLMMHVVPQIPSTLLLAQRIVELNSLYQTQLNPFIRNPGDPASDHQAFWITGSNAIGYSEDYDNDFNPHWHRFSDSVTYFNLPYYYKMAKLAAVSVCDLASTGKLTSLNKPLQSHKNRLLFNNPVSDHIWVSTQNIGGHLNLELIDMKGTPVWNTEMDENTPTPIPTYLENGIYIMKVQTEGHTFVARIFIQRP
jgi:hypothetical protein